MNKIKRYLMILSSLIVLLCTITTTSIAQETDPNAVTPSQEVRIKEEVKLIIEKYYTYFSANQMDKFPLETHTIPWTLLGTGRVYSTPEASNENYYGHMKILKRMIQITHVPSLQYKTFVCYHKEPPSLVASIPENAPTTAL